MTTFLPGHISDLRIVQVRDGSHGGGLLRVVNVDAIERRNGDDHAVRDLKQRRVCCSLKQERTATHEDSRLVKGAQLHGHETPGMVEEVAKNLRWVIKAVTAGSPTTPGERAVLARLRGVSPAAPPRRAGRVGEF